MCGLLFPYYPLVFVFFDFFFLCLFRCCWLAYFLFFFFSSLVFVCLFLTFLPFALKKKKRRAIFQMNWTARERES